MTRQRPPRHDRPNHLEPGPCIAILSLLAAAPAALAEEELTLLQSFVAHPSFIVVLLGITEGLALWILAKTPTLLLPAAVMIGVNLLSFPAGLGTILSTYDTTLPTMAARIGVAFLVTVLIEWPAVRVATLGTKTKWSKALSLCATANVITFFGWLVYAPIV